MGDLTSRAGLLRELAVPGGDLTGDRRFSIPATLGLSVVAMGCCYLLVGTSFSVIGAGLGVAMFSYRHDPARPAAMGAFLLFVAAAVATVVEDRPGAGDPTLAFAAHRPIASAMGTMAGALLTVAVVVFSISERPRHAGPPQQRLVGPVRRLRSTLTDLRASGLMSMFPRVFAAGMIAVVLRVAAGPRPLPASLDGMVRNVRTGVGFAMIPGRPASMVGDVAPLGVVVGAFSPLGDRVALLVVGLSIIAMTARLAYRWRGRRAAVASATLAAVLPACWDAPLGVSLAALFVLVAVNLAWWPDSGGTAELDDRGRGFGLGVCVGLAVLARPDAVVLVPALLAGWWYTNRRAGVRVGPSTSALCWMAVAGVAVVAPWVNYVWSNFHVVLVDGGVRSFVADPGSSHRLPGPLVMVIDLAVILAVVFVGSRRFDQSVAFASRRTWPTLVMVMLIGASVMMAVARPFDRGLLSWAAPLVAVLLGLQLTAPSPPQRGTPDSRP